VTIKAFRKSTLRLGLDTAPAAGEFQQSSPLAWDFEKKTNRAGDF